MTLKRHKGATSHYIKKGVSKGTLTNGKLAGISLNAERIISKKVNISFIVHFCLGIHSSNLENLS